MSIIKIMTQEWKDKEYPKPDILFAKDLSGIAYIVAEDHRVIHGKKINRIVTLVDADTNKAFVIPMKYLKKGKDYYTITDSDKLIISSCRGPVNGYDELALKIFKRSIDKLEDI